MALGEFWQEPWTNQPKSGDVDQRFGGREVGESADFADWRRFPEVWRLLRPKGFTAPLFITLELFGLLFMGMINFMRPYSLALILIKVLGISGIIDGLAHLSSLLGIVFTPLLLLMKGFPVTAKIIMDCAVQAIELPAGLVGVVLGVFLLLKADWVVKKVMKIDDTNPDA